MEPKATTETSTEGRRKLRTGPTQQYSKLRKGYLWAAFLILFVVIFFLFSNNLALKKQLNDRDEYNKKLLAYLVSENSCYVPLSQSVGCSDYQLFDRNMTREFATQCENGQTIARIPLNNVINEPEFLLYNPHDQNYSIIELKERKNAD